MIDEKEQFRNDTEWMLRFLMKDMDDVMSQTYEGKDWVASKYIVITSMVKDRVERFCAEHEIELDEKKVLRELGSTEQTDDFKGNPLTLI